MANYLLIGSVSTIGQLMARNALFFMRALGRLGKPDNIPVQLKLFAFYYLN